MKVTKSMTYDLGARPTLADLRQIVNDTYDLDEDTTFSVKAGSNQLDGSWCYFTINAR